jgi:hypothetical protein
MNISTAKVAKGTLINIQRIHKSKASWAQSTPYLTYLPLKHQSLSVPILISVED